jgi:hypothetical protein
MRAVLKRANERSRGKLRVIERPLYIWHFLKTVTPEFLYRGSTMLTTTLSHVEWVGGPDPDFPGFPLKTCWNDGLRIGDLFDAASCAE